MSKYVFISGKNWSLSLAELVSYFKTRQIDFEIEYFSREFFVIAFKLSLNNSIITDLGGTTKIAEVKKTFSTQIVKDAFGKKSKQAQGQIFELLSSSGIAKDITFSSGKLFFGISVYCTNNYLQSALGSIQRFVGSSIKEDLVKLGKKAQFMGFKDKKQYRLSNVEVIKKELVENKAEILFCIGKNETWVGSTVLIHNPFDFQKRDVYKPNQRAIFAMPPRLAKIMVNLAGCKEEKTLLDPFCGVGTILQEAMLEGASVIGIDVNFWCVKAAEENLEWLTREYELKEGNFRILQGDVGKLAEKVGLNSVDCIVSEPDLGPPLKQFPTEPYAKKIIKKLEPLFSDFIKQAYEALKKDGRLVLVTPYIRTRSRQPVTMSTDELLRNTGFERFFFFSKYDFFEGLDVGRLIHASSLIEVDEHHKVGREIRILKK
jgi:tRNA G10  N-methylase Trm11